MTPASVPTATEERLRLVEVLERRLAQASDQEHRLSRLRGILTRCVTRLRMGEAASVILAELGARGIRFRGL